MAGLTPTLTIRETAGGGLKLAMLMLINWIWNKWSFPYLGVHIWKTIFPELVKHPLSFELTDQLLLQLGIIQVQDSLLLPTLPALHGHFDLLNSASHPQLGLNQAALEDKAAQRTATEVFSWALRGNRWWRPCRPTAALSTDCRVPHILCCCDGRHFRRFGHTQVEE